MKYIDIIKNEYFSDKNTAFIKSLYGNCDKEILFRVQNDTFSLFIDSIQNKNIDPSQLDDLLITLNKVTIDNMSKNVKSYKISNDKGNTPEDELKNEIKILKTKLNKEISLLNNEINVLKNDITELQTNKIQINKKPQLETTKSNIECNVFNLFSQETNVDNDYIFDLSNFDVSSFDYLTLEITDFNISNKLYNIVVGNNRLYLNNILVVIPIGLYTIDNLINVINDIMKKKVIEKVENTERICFNVLNVKFIEADSTTFPLRYILGFSKYEYKNNNKYIAEHEHNINYITDIYIKVNDCKTIITNENFIYSFKYLKSINYSCTINTNELVLSFFYKPNKFNFYKIKQSLTFDFIATLHH